MGLIEVHPRSFSQRFGEPPSATRTFIDTPDVPTVDLLPALGAEHPEFVTLKCVSVDKSTGYGGDPDQISYLATYAPAPSCEQEPNPLNRCDTWSIGTGGSSAAVTEFYEEDDSTSILKNTAGDVITGYTKRRLEMRLSVSGNRSTFPLATAKAAVNTINGSAWGGGAEKTWLCSGATANQETELVGTDLVSYWQVTFEFLFNAETWDLQVPNIGLNRIGANGNKYRIYVRDQDGNYVPSPKPLPLNLDGSLAADGSDPIILTRRVYPTINFSAFFGNPPVS